MKTSLTPLPRRSRLLSGESLPSLVARLETLNFHSPGTFRWLCRRDTAMITGSEISPDNMARPRRALTYSQLAALSGLEPAVLFSASDHRFAPMLAAPGRAQERITLPGGDKILLVDSYTRRKRVRSAHNAQFCPACLQAAAYHRLCWTPVASAICLEHLCLLTDQCPRCGKWVAIAEVVKARCRECGADLTQAPAVSVASDALGVMSQRFIQFWLTVAPEPQDYGLSEYPPAAWYRLVDDICLCLAACQDAWDKLLDPLPGLPELTQVETRHWSTLPPLSSYRLYRAAFQSAVNWPHGFYDFLDACQKNPGGAISLSGLFGKPLMRCIQQTWLGPEFEFVQSAFADYVLSGRIPLAYVLRRGHFRNDERLVKHYGLLNRKQAAQILGVSEWAVSSFARSGKLRPACVPMDKTSLLLLRQDKILEIAQAWKKGLPIEDVCCWLGLTERVIVRLVETGMLNLEQGNPATHQSEWLFNKQSIIELAGAIANNVKSPDEIGSELISLPVVSEKLWSMPLDSASLLKRVAEGQLQGYILGIWRDRLSTLCFLETDVQLLTQAIVSKGGWVTDEDIARRLDVSIKAIFALWQKDHRQVYYGLRPIARCDDFAYFEPQVVERFYANCLTLEQAAKLLEMSKTTLMRRYVLTDRLYAIADPRYDGSRRYVLWRPDVERLMAWKCTRTKRQTTA